jgi:hypothetical protein
MVEKVELVEGIANEPCVLQVREDVSGHLKPHAHRGIGRGFHRTPHTHTHMPSSVCLWVMV